MVAVIIIILVLFGLAMIRLSLDIRVVETKLYIWVKVLFFKIQIYPIFKKTSAKTRGKTKKSAEKSKKTKVKKDNRELARVVLRVAGRLRRKLGIKQLVFHYTAGSEDPADTALQYGRVSAAVYGMLPVVCKTFNIKRQDVSVNVDFDIPKPLIELEIDIGLFVWQLIYIGTATLIDFSKLQSNN